MIKHSTPNANLFLIDDMPPEDVAMLQALYSRSPLSVEAHVQRLLGSRSDHEPAFRTLEEAKAAPGKVGRFMGKHYVNYGHKSIGDCGTTTLFIENVSLLTAKAVQDWPLYNGQETSTRYLDMSERRIVDPADTLLSKQILDAWMEFYRRAMPLTVEHVRKTHARKPDEKEDAYEGAVRARAFDIMRGFLPAGITTQLSWHTNIRQAGDHLIGLCNHPLEEVGSVGDSLRTILDARYPSSGLALSLPSVSGVGSSEGRDARAAWEHNTHWLWSYPVMKGSENQPAFSTTIGLGSIVPYADLLTSRPRGAVLPHFLSDLGQCTFRTLLDFGSFRDAQRHRNGVCRMPMLTTAHGFESWYVESLPPILREEANMLIGLQINRIHLLESRIGSTTTQNYVALGFRVPCQFTYALPATVYVLDLRSGKTIHPTYRKVIHRMIADFQSTFPSVTLHVDRDEDDWTVRRGLQTIRERA